MKKKSSTWSHLRPWIKRGFQVNMNVVTKLMYQHLQVWSAETLTSDDITLVVVGTTGVTVASLATLRV